MLHEQDQQIKDIIKVVLNTTTKLHIHITRLAMAHPMVHIRPGAVLASDRQLHQALDDLQCHLQPQLLALT